MRDLTPAEQRAWNDPRRSLVIRGVIMENIRREEAKAALPIGDGVATSAPWLQTLGSGAIDLVNPQPAQISFDAIATALARIPRFGGHTDNGAYSVAQHCVEGARAILRDTSNSEWAAAFLLHDAHEAYMGDIATPVAKALALHAEMVTGDIHVGHIVTDAITSIKSVLDSAIYYAAGIMWPLDAQTRNIVKLYDARMGRTERDARMGPAPRDWMDRYSDAVPVEGCDLSWWHETQSYVEFATTARKLLPTYR